MRTIPAGQVASYGDVAAALGRPRAARAVGGALARLPDDSDVPWWRVINGRGVVSTPDLHHHARIQRALLEHDGIRFGPDGRIDWERFGWEPEPEP
ncbi:MAG: MGMT family protein [Gemmatimonadetes bacterium]|nr:MAG: MGMT family protein [Gemmatimonadota bacterium]